MMKILNKNFMLLISFLGLFFFQTLPAAAQGGESEIKMMLEQRDQEIKELVGPKGTEYTEEQRKQLKDIINGVIDYPAMARYALQDTYKNLSEEEKSEFINLFSTVIRDHSLKNLNIYRADVKYDRIEVKEDSAVVETMAQLERVRTPVTYKMMYNNNRKEWVVTDIVIDDVSTAGSYRRQFQNIIDKKGYASLVETLEKRVKKEG